MGFLSTVPSDERSNAHEVGHDQYISTTVYGSALAACEFPRLEMREEEMPVRTAARFVHDELLMDGSPALNLASFVTTYMEDEAERLMLENLVSNYANPCSLSLTTNLFFVFLPDSKLSRRILSTLRNTLLLGKLRAVV